MTRGGMPLIGTWTLKEWRNVTPDGRSVWPLGREATGYISYSADGHVFVHLMAAGRTHYVVSDPFGGTPEEDAAAMKSQITYAGRYDFHGDHVVHHVTHASFPNWIGSAQRRVVTLAGDALRLSADGVLFQGQTVTARVDWLRAAPFDQGDRR